jgi:alpha-1,3-rhamnosyl/mannosyltransferase
VLPSFFEGFGLPVLEAMACKVPVITSNAASLPEVSGSLSPHFDPNDPVAMKDAIVAVLGDERNREILAEKGVSWAKNFSWERTVQETLEIFARIAKEGKKR